jgi:hypothetical protein
MKLIGKGFLAAILLVVGIMFAYVGGLATSAIPTTSGWEPIGLALVMFFSFIMSGTCAWGALCCFKEEV